MDRGQIVATNLQQVQEELASLREELDTDHSDVDRLKRLVSEAEIIVFATGQLFGEED